jgi:hypothetical protein
MTPQLLKLTKGKKNTMAARAFGIMLVKEYRAILNEIFNESLTKARAQVSTVKIEEKAWNILGRPDIWTRKHAIETQLDKLTREKMELAAGSCTGEKSPFEVAKEEAKTESEKLAWEKLGRPDIFERDQALRKEEESIKKRRQELKAEMSVFDGQGYYSDNPLNNTLKELRKTEDARAWAKLGREDLTAKERDLNEMLAKIADEEKPFNGNVCEIKRRIDRTFFERHAPSDYKSPLDEARWQAKELLYPQESELRDAKRKAEQELLLAGVPEKVGEIVNQMRKELEAIIK